MITKWVNIFVFIVYIQTAFCNISKKKFIQIMKKFPKIISTLCPIILVLSIVFFQDANKLATCIHMVDFTLDLHTN